MNLDENLVKLVTKQPSPRSPAARLAKHMGLRYMGFGRYADRDGKIKYVVDKQGNLIPFKSNQDLMNLHQQYNKAKWDDLEIYDVQRAEAGIPRDEKEYKKRAEKAKAIQRELNQSWKIRSERFREDQKEVFFKTKEERRLDKSLRDFYKSELFNDDEREAIRAYIGAFYEYMNSYLYKGHEPNEDIRSREFITDMHKAMVNLDQAFEGVQAPFSFPVYTGLGRSVPLEHLRPGSKYIFRGYLSTSISHKVAIDSFSFEHRNGKDKDRHKVVLQIDIQKGDPGIYTSDLSHFKGEKEFLLPRGTMIEIVSGPHPFDQESIMGYDWHIQGDVATNVMLFHCKLVPNKEE